MQEIKQILLELPHSPGVYQFFNKNNELLYIGKSKNLKSRVNSYFSGTQKLNFAKKKMISHIHDIKYIVTNNETESLILENDLVKKHQPKYNVLLKDGKNFLYIKVTKEEFPQVRKTRISPSNMKKSDGVYYGPYISSFHVYEVLKLLKKIFGYGVGKNNFFKKKGAYSLDKYIFEGNSQKDEELQKKLYLEKIQRIKYILSGNTQEVKTNIYNEMLACAKLLDFEGAQKKKIEVEALETLETLQVVRDGVKGEYIVIQILNKYDNYYLGVIDIKEGKIVAYENTQVKSELHNDDLYILQSVVEQKWIENKDRKNLRFLMPKNLPDLLEEIQVEVPKIGVKHDLLKLCYKNIYEYAHKKYMEGLASKSFTKQNMRNLLCLLGYQEINSDIIFECNDISHLSGSHTVASRSVIENGKKASGKYKKFRIKTLEEGKIDDFASLGEIMTRRLKEIEKLGNIPDLIIIDGGKGQLSSVMKIIQEYSWQETDRSSELQIVSIAKKEEELFLPGASDPIVLEKESPELRLTQAIRDEAHRFAISFNRDSRSKSLKKNILESLPGIGPVTRKKIIKLYGSTSALSEYTHNDIEQELGKKVADVLEDHGLLKSE